MNPFANLFQAIAMAFLLASVLWAPVASATPTGRNILFIAIDDLRHEPQAITPNLDAFAAQSTVYTNAYTSVPSCVGSRTTVMTGLSPATHQVGLTVFDLSGYHQLFNDPGVTTLPEVLGDNGYYTATMGKVSHVRHPSKWDHSEPYQTIFSFFNPWDPGPDGTYLEASVLDPNEVHPDQEVADWAEGFINNYNGAAPFFLAIGFYQPHIPWRVHQWAYDLYPAPSTYDPVAGDLDDEPFKAVALAAQLVWQQVPNYDLVQNAGKTLDYTRGYLASISHTDKMVGQVLDALANSVHAANTDIVVWSDNGYHLGEKFHWRKMTFWEQSVKVPLYIQSPAIAAGTVSAEVSLLDLPSTIVDLAGLSPEPQFEGLSLVTSASPVEIYYDDGRATVVNGTKSIDYNLDLESENDIASYYLPDDPQELVNLTPPSGC